MRRFRFWLAAKIKPREDGKIIHFSYPAPLDEWVHFEWHSTESGWHGHFDMKVLSVCDPAPLTGYLDGVALADS